MSTTRKLVLNQVGRITIGAFAGLFLGKVLCSVMKDEKPIGKIVAFIGAECLGLGVGHGIDLWWDRLLPIDEEMEKWAEEELWKTEE